MMLVSKNPLLWFHFVGWWCLCWYCDPSKTFLSCKEDLVMVFWYRKNVKKHTTYKVWRGTRACICLLIVSILWGLQSIHMLLLVLFVSLLLSVCLFGLFSCLVCLVCLVGLFCLFVVWFVCLCFFPFFLCFFVSFLLSCFLAFFLSFFCYCLFSCFFGFAFLLFCLHVSTQEFLNMDLRYIKDNGCPASWSWKDKRRFIDHQVQPFTGHFMDDLNAHSHRWDKLLEFLQQESQTRLGSFFLSQFGSLGSWILGKHNNNTKYQVTWIL